MAKHLREFWFVTVNPRRLQRVRLGSATSSQPMTMTFEKPAGIFAEGSEMKIRHLAFAGDTFVFYHDAESHPGWFHGVAGIFLDELEARQCFSQEELESPDPAFAETTSHARQRVSQHPCYGVPDNVCYRLEAS